MTNAQASRGVLIAAFNGKLFAVDRQTGEQRWKVQLGDSWTTSVVELIITDDRVIALSSMRLAVVDYATGRVLRDEPRQEKSFGTRCVALVDDGHLFVGGDGGVACYTLDGVFKWEQYFVGEGHGRTALGFPNNVRQADDRGSK